MQINVAEYWLDKIEDSSIESQQAIVDDKDGATFGELFQKAGTLAMNLMKRIGLRQPVAVFLPKSVELVAADMAIIYSGNAYNNLDVKQPPERTRLIVEHIDPALVLTSSVLRNTLEKSGIAEEKIFCIDEAMTGAYNIEAIRQRLSEIVDTDPLCIINTSGSTGVPKGVVMNHRSVIDFMSQVIDALSLTGEEVIGSLSPSYFDIFTLEFYLTMAKQATFVIIPDSASAFPERLVSFLEEKRVNFIFWVPTIMVNIANMDILDEHPLTDLKKVLYAGEVFPVKHLRYWMEHIPTATFVNMYGPIEITVDCLYHIISQEDIDNGEVPIGKPFRNTRMLILNDDGKECAIEEPGELCIGGTSLAMGYYNDPEKTAKAFVQNPLNKTHIEMIYRTGDTVCRRKDGNVVFIGRKDFQVKHLGYRIELGEIEHVIVSLPFIDNAAVLYDHDQKKIILVYETQKGTTPLMIRQEAGRVLPKYMLPTAYHELKDMPRNPNGKIDCVKLKEMFVK